MKKILFLVSILLLIYGCATPGIKSYRNALQSRSIEDLEQAYLSLKEEYTKKPNDLKIKIAFEDSKRTLADQYYEKQEYLSGYNLLEKKQFLQKAFDLNPEIQNISNELLDIDKQIESVKVRVKIAIENKGSLESFKEYLALQDYEPYFDIVKELKDKIIGSKELLLEKISELAKKGNDDEAIVYYSIGENVFKDIPEFGSKKEELLLKKANFAISLAKQYIDVKGNDRIATSIIYLLMAWNYDKNIPQLKEMINSQLVELKKKAVMNLIIEFSGSFSDKQKKESLSCLERYKNIGQIDNFEERTEGYNFKDNDIICTLNLDDLSIDNKPIQSVKYSKYLAGYQNVPNPTYDSLAIQYTQALQNFNIAAQQYAQNPANWGAAFSKAYCQGQAQQFANALAATPQYIQEPIYQTYQYEQVDFNYQLEFKLKYKVMDTSTQLILKEDVFENRKNVTKVVISGAHPSDSNGIKNIDKAIANPEAILADFSKESFDKLSELLVNSLVRKNNIFKAEAAFKKNNFGQVIDEIFKYRLLKWLTDLQPLKSINDDKIKYISKDLNIIDINEFIIKSTSDGNHSLDLSVNNIFKNSFLSDSFLTEELLEFKEAFNSFNPEKFEYRKEGNIKNANFEFVLFKQNQNKIPVAQESANSIIDECLPSVVIVKTSQGTGSGFIISTKGYIVTNYHVITDQDNTTVELNDGRKVFADIISLVKFKDLALLKINATNIKPIKIGNINKVKIGESVYAIGAPGVFQEALEKTVTKGIVSSIRLLEAPYNPLEKIQFIQTDAAINPGNSGGPLINEKGEVLGVNSQKMVKMDVEGINFAISIEEVKKSFAEYLK